MPRLGSLWLVVVAASASSVGTWACSAFQGEEGAPRTGIVADAATEGGARDAALDDANETDSVFLVATFEETPFTLPWTSFDQGGGMAALTTAKSISGPNSMRMAVTNGYGPRLTKGTDGALSRARCSMHIAVETMGSVGLRLAELYVGTIGLIVDIQPTAWSFQVYALDSDGGIIWTNNAPAPAPSPEDFHELAIEYTSTDAEFSLDGYSAAKLPIPSGVGQHVELRIGALYTLGVSWSVLFDEVRCTRTVP
jgi:hypothetical protein